MVCTMFGVELAMSDLIQFAGVFVALLVGVASSIISVVAICQNARIVREGNMAQVVVFPIWNPDEKLGYIRFQNFGKTFAEIIDIATDGYDFDNRNFAFENPFIYFKGCTLAPSQYIQAVIHGKTSEEDASEIVFTVTVVYETLGKRITSNHSINFMFSKANTILDTKSGTTTIDALNQINRNIHILAHK